MISNKKDKKDFWFYEKDYEIEPLYTKIQWKVREVLFTGKSKYQEIGFYNTYDHGVLFALDNIVMCTEKDEFIYHEIISHVPILSHPKAKSILVIGGGDGGVLTQLIKHDFIENIELCEIDSLVLEKCEKFLPYLKQAKLDPRVKIHVEDGINFLDSRKIYTILLLLILQMKILRNRVYFLQNHFLKNYIKI